MLCSNFSELRGDMNIKFDDQNNKFDEQKSEVNKINNNFNGKFDEVNSRFDISDSKMNDQINEIKNEIKQQNFSINQHIHETNVRYENMTEQIIESISNHCEKKINEMNKNLDRKLDQIINKKLGNSVRDLRDNNNDKIVEVVALENKILNNDDNCEIKVGVENVKETDQLNENKDDQVTYNMVSRGEKNDDIIKNVVLELSLIHI